MDAQSPRTTPVLVPVDRDTYWRFHLSLDRQWYFGSRCCRGPRARCVIAWDLGFQRCRLLGKSPRSDLVEELPPWYFHWLQRTYLKMLTWFLIELDHSSPFPTSSRQESQSNDGLLCIVQCWFFHHRLHMKSYWLSPQFSPIKNEHVNIIQTLLTFSSSENVSERSRQKWRQYVRNDARPDSLANRSISIFG